MSVEQTTQLIQLILNSVLLSVACAIVLGGLIARHTAIGQQLQSFYRLEHSVNESQEWLTGITQLSRSRLNRKQMHRLRYRFQISRYSVLSAYYALLFAGLSCFTLVLRGLMEWNGLIPIALGCFVIGVATLLVSVGLTLVDWHLSDRALLDEVQQLLSFGNNTHFTGARAQSRERPNASSLNSRDRSKIRVS